MRYLVLSDIHSNLEALEDCLADASNRGYDKTIVLGDVIGYGADPNAVVARVQALEPVSLVRGNHDKISLGMQEADGFNSVAIAAAEWTLTALTFDNRAWVAGLPRGPMMVDDVVEICHGAPYDEDAYVFDELDAIRAFESLTRPVCLYGHTHCPVVFSLANGSLRGEVVDPRVETRVPFADSTSYLINPGSVGQPRDGDPRAAYAIADTTAKSIYLLRVPYPIQVTQEKIVRAGLPRILADRLSKGR
jgi:predicted phosphodiesterase